MALQHVNVCNACTSWHVFFVTLKLAMFSSTKPLSSAAVSSGMVCNTKYPCDKQGSGKNRILKLVPRTVKDNKKKRGSSRKLTLQQISTDLETRPTHETSSLKLVTPRSQERRRQGASHADEIVVNDDLLSRLKIKQEKPFLRRQIELRSTVNVPRGRGGALWVTSFHHCSLVRW